MGLHNAYDLFLPLSFQTEPCHYPKHPLGSLIHPFPSPWQPLILLSSLLFRLFQNVLESESYHMWPFGSDFFPLVRYTMSGSVSSGPGPQLCVSHSGLAGVTAGLAHTTSLAASSPVDRTWFPPVGSVSCCSGVPQSPQSPQRRSFNPLLWGSSWEDLTWAAVLFSVLPGVPKSLLLAAVKGQNV